MTDSDKISAYKNVLTLFERSRQQLFDRYMELKQQNEELTKKVQELQERIDKIGKHA